MQETQAAVHITLRLVVEAAVDYRPLIPELTPRAVQAALLVALQLLLVEVEQGARRVVMRELLAQQVHL
jgi:hypothetical protein